VVLVIAWLRKMLRRLRLQFTLLYTLAAVSLVALVSVGAYQLLGYYFQRETDLALSYKMATLFRQYEVTLPPELALAEQTWLEGKVVHSLRPTSSSSLPASSDLESEGEDDKNDNEGNETQIQVPGVQTGPPEEGEDRYDAQLASIYVLPIDARGQVINIPGFLLPGFSPDQAASQSALAQGHDLRTITLADGARVRLLTYRLDGLNGTLFQIGRMLTDQDRLLSQFLVGLLLLGCASSILVGLGSWSLSGKSLRPAQQSWEQQQAFVSNASHELRTPLTLIQASAEVGLRGKADEEQKQLLTDILGECKYMDRLVDDLLLLSRLDTRRLQMKRSRISLRDLLEETVEQAGKLVAQKNIRLELGSTQGVVLGDSERLRQVLLILLDNAIRFTPEGGIIRLESIPKRKTCQVIVSDNGSGIAPDHLPHIFERFYQANPTGEAQARSNGLGLSIAKGIIDDLGGRIHVESLVGRGTRVTLELPGG
jgi:signal transduction histidine kinase